MAFNNLSFFCVALVNVLLMIAISNNPAEAAEEFKVGDAQGWHQPGVNNTRLYSLWASRRKFHVGDSLRFEYKNDSVLVVDKWAYYHCNSSNPISHVFNDGNTMITLNKPGPVYFISGDLHHCEDGQRLLIEVLELHPRSHTPPAMPTPPEPYSEMAPAPSPLSNSGVKLSETVVSVSMASTMAASIVFLIA